jgi:hypothetical protein
MRKNVAGQIIGIQMLATDGSNFTGTVTVYITGDNGTQAIGTVGSGVCTHKGKGFHTYAPSQAETNYDHIAFTFEGTGAITATLQVYTRVDVNITHWLATAVTGDGDWAELQGDIDDILVDTGTSGVIVATNNDKTGYSLTQAFPTNFASLAITVGGAVTVGTNSDKTGYSVSGTITTLDALDTALDAAHGGGSWATATGFSTFDHTTDQVTVAVNNDKTGYSLTQAFPSNFASLAITVGGAVTVGTNSDKTGYSISGTITTLDALDTALDAAHGGGSWATATGFSTFDHTTDQVTVATNNDKTGYSLTQAFPSNFASLAITVGGAVTVGTNNDKSGYSISGTITTLDALDTALDSAHGGGSWEAPSAATVADAVWDELLSGHVIAGSAGAALSAASSAGDPWATALPGAYSAGTAGHIIGNLNDLSMADIRTAVGLASANLDTQLSGLSTFDHTSDQVTVATNNDKTGYSLTQAFPSNFASLAITGGGAVTVGTNNDKTGYSISGTLTTLDALDTALDSAHGGGNWEAPSAATIADAVWDELLSGHVIAGSAGAALAAAGSAGDPWSTLLPGAYSAGTAGHIIGNLNDLSAAEIRTAVGLAAANLDTQLAAMDTILDRFNTMIELDGSVYRYTTNALELAPAGSGGGSTAAQIWSYASRTLTMTAQQIQDVVESNLITIHRGDTISISLTGLGDLSDAYDIIFTIKRSSGDPEDSASMLQVRMEGGLIYLNGEVAADSALGDILVVDEAEGDIEISVEAEASAELVPSECYVCDVQVLRYPTGTVNTVHNSACHVIEDVTRGIV